MSFLELFKLEKDKTCIVLSLTNGKREENVGRRRIYSGLSFGIFLERESTSLYISSKSDRRNPSEQEGKLFYAERSMRGHWI